MNFEAMKVLLALVFIIYVAFFIGYILAPYKKDHFEEIENEKDFLKNNNNYYDEG